MYNASPALTFTLADAIVLLTERPDLLPRLSSWASPVPVTVTSPADVARIVTPMIGGADVENLVVIPLDSRARVLGATVLTIGSVGHTVFPIPGILRHVLTYPTARAFVVAHNHPSGDCIPSADDIRVTASLSRACVAVELQFQDHVIVTPGGAWTSLVASGYFR